RAATLEPDFPDLTARRITTHVRRKRLKEAEELVNAASAIRLKEPPMQAAAAYFHYVRGNHDEAGVILQKMLDPSVTLPDAIRAYARQAAYAIGDHRNKQVWTDQFNRTDPRIGREWKVEKGAGVNVTLVDQAVLFDGAQSGVSDRPTYLHQERPGDKLHAFSIDLNLEAPLDGVFAGAGLMARSKTAPKEKWPGYQDRADGWAPQAGLQVAIDPAGKLVWRKLEQTKMSDWQEVPGAPEGARSLTLEFRQSNPAEGKWDVLVNREALLKDVEISDLKRWSRTLELQAFCYGRLGAKVRFTVDNATIVTLKEKR
ncbi:MAG TPA: hypothetical protein VEI02_00880, partial [Planctomycetota bacterium]|nr:hypothetical protein [Planctomycetota bacterium]